MGFFSYSYSLVFTYIWGLWFIYGLMYEFCLVKWPTNCSIIVYLRKKKGRKKKPSLTQWFVMPSLLCSVFLYVLGSVSGLCNLILSCLSIYHTIFFITEALYYVYCIIEVLFPLQLIFLSVFLAIASFSYEF